MRSFILTLVLCGPVVVNATIVSELSDGQPQVPIPTETVKIPGGASVQSTYTAISTPTMTTLQATSAMPKTSECENGGGSASTTPVASFYSVSTPTGVQGGGTASTKPLPTSSYSTASPLVNSYETSSICTSALQTSASAGSGPTSIGPPSVAATTTGAVTTSFVTATPKVSGAAPMLEPGFVMGLAGAAMLGLI